MQSFVEVQTAEADASELSPEALVRRAHKGKIFTRKARGFSIGEIAKAGIELLAARKMGLMVDLRRRTTHEPNVDLLKKLSTGSRTSIPRLRGESAKVSAEEGLVEPVEAAE